MDLPVAPERTLRHEGSNTAPLVIAGGLLTTALALGGVWWANQAGENIMGWYAYYVIPAGALLVGVGAASGYAGASYLSGTKITGRLLVTVLALLAVGYVVAQYVEFKLLYPEGAMLEDGTELGFPAYFDLATRSIYWKAERSGQADGAPLGLWGYGLRALELIGFVGGGAVIPLALRKLPFCAACQSYKKTRRVALFPAGVLRRGISKKKVEELQAYQEQDAEAARRGEAELESLLAIARESRGRALAEETSKLGKLGSSKAQKYTARISVDLVHCPRCREGELVAKRCIGQGNQISETEIARQPMDRAAVEEFLRAGDRARPAA